MVLRFSMHFKLGKAPRIKGNAAQCQVVVLNIGRATSAVLLGDAPSERRISPKPTGVHRTYTCEFADRARARSPWTPRDARDGAADFPYLAFQVGASGTHVDSSRDIVKLRPLSRLYRWLV